MALPNLSLGSLFCINIASIPSKRGKYSRPRASNHAESSSMSTGRVKCVNSSSILMKAAGLGSLRSSVPAVCRVHSPLVSLAERLKISKSKRSPFDVTIVCTLTGSSDSTKARPMVTFFNATSSCSKIKLATAVAISKNALAGKTTAPKTR